MNKLPENKILAADPCPHCGGMAVLQPSGRKRVMVRCAVCECRTQDRHEVDWPRAVREWNARAEVPESVRREIMAEGYRELARELEFQANDHRGITTIAQQSLIAFYLILDQEATKKERVIE